MEQNIAHNLNEKQRTRDVILEENISFESLLLPLNIKSGLTASGFRKPSPIQFKAVPLGRCGFDLIVKSKAGTGKTLVFSIIALETVNVSREQLQVLILAPTREIAVQIQDVLRNVGRHIDGLVIESFIGGMPLEADIQKAKLCHIAVGAPGRVKHLIKMGALSTKSVRLFVLDEADKLMESSFQIDINEIYNTLPQRKQMIASSATYPQELDTFLANYMLSPTQVTSENETPLLLGLRQFVAVLKAGTVNAVQEMKAKNEFLVEIFSKISFTQCLVFTNYQTRTESVYNYLNQNGWSSSFISAAQDQSDRLEAISNLKNFKTRILLSTDLTSRGIDAPNVDLVINYDLPHDAVSYLHRIGRAGRYGSFGICINFALEGDTLNRLQNILGTIGSTNLSISKLPPLNGEVDVWQVDPNTLEQICGVVPSTDLNCIREDLKKELWELKKRENSKKDHDKIKNKKKGGKKIKLEELSKVECIEDVLSNKEKEVEELGSSNLVDTENLLNSLLSGEDKKRDKEKEGKKIKLEDLNRIENVKEVLSNEEKEMEDVKSSSFADTENLLNSLLSDDDTKRDKGKGGKKIKLEELSRVECVKDLLNSKGREVEDMESSTFLDAENLLSSLLSDGIKMDRQDERKNDTILAEESPEERKCDIQNVTFTRNKALLSDYLTVLKNFNDEGHASSVEEILRFSDENLEDVVPKVDEKDFLEDIFRIGYECAVTNEKSWLDLLPSEELERFRDFCAKEQVTVSSSDASEEEADEDYEMEDYEEVQEELVAAQSYPEQDPALQWVPVVQHEPSNETRSDHFAQCYEDCSNILWRDGLTFESVAAFDEWFYRWQEHLHSVRHYVQQNIYVDEMSKYQQNRLTDK
ncbi:probable ATP-dependent RNA helicase DDX20 isoform X2 [Tenebrio molitor]|uniref:probable ATP-dependent RNA helicase DDX20 isoform X2 n=1 Tax=Tenebrio molitor TaxID=7067 RepID=UPI00362478F2